MASSGLYYRVSTTATHANVELTIADTEYSYVIPAGTRKLKFQNRSGNNIRYAFVGGKVATPTPPYFTLKANDVWYADNINFYSKTLYFAGTNAGDVVEIEAMQ